MTDDQQAEFAPAWLVLGTIGSGLLALGSLFLGGAAADLLTGALVLCTLLGTTALLYLWGKHRNQPSTPEDSDEKRKVRELEVQAEVGGSGMS